MMVIKYYVKYVYGSLVMYPANEAAKVLAEIAGNKSLRQSDLYNAEKLGFEVKEVLNRDSISGRRRRPPGPGKEDYK